jgi:hypothetical protein
MGYMSGFCNPFFEPKAKDILFDVGVGFGFAQISDVSGAWAGLRTPV